MTENDLKNETQARQLLLGKLPDDERMTFEEGFFANEDLFETVRVVEDELIESYVRGTLPPADRERFERVFLATNARRQRVQFARTMLDRFDRENQLSVAEKAETKKKSFRDSVVAFFKAPALAFGAAFALLILIFGGWLLLKNSQPLEIAQKNTPTPTIEKIEANTNRNSTNLNLTANENVSVQANSNAHAAEKTPANRNASTNANVETPPKNSNSNLKPLPQNILAPTLALFSGIGRGEGKMPELVLPKNAGAANLRLNLDSQDYKIYRAEIVDPDGNLIFSGKNLRAANSKINFTVSTAKLQRGDYIVKLSARNPKGENESVADYAFRVSRK